VISIGISYNLLLLLTLFNDLVCLSDRYLAITKPLTYGVRRTAKRILSFIGAVWIASVLISIPPLLVLGNEHGTDDLPTCEVSQNIGYQLYATLGAFYIPLTVMIVMYYKIYIAAKRVVEAELRDQRPSYAAPQLPLLRTQLKDSNHHMKKQDTNHVWTRIKGCDCYENTQKTETIPINVDQHSMAKTLRQTNGMSTTGSGTTILTSQPSSSLKPAVETQQKRSSKRSSDSSTINTNTSYKRRASNALRERKASFTLGNNFIQT